MAYELWNAQSGNLVDTFSDRVEALWAAKELILARGSSYASRLVLSYENEHGDTLVIASADRLIDELRLLEVDRLRKGA